MTAQESGLRPPGDISVPALRPLPLHLLHGAEVKDQPWCPALPHLSKQRLRFYSRLR